jgi:hypothetical protein
VLQSVENLLTRCTSRFHGMVLKHTETPKSDDDFGRAYGLLTLENFGSAEVAAAAAGVAAAGTGAGAGAGAAAGELPLLVA